MNKILMIENDPMMVEQAQERLNCQSTDGCGVERAGSKGRLFRIKFAYINLA